MIDVSRSITIAKPMKDVYAFVSHTENEPRWHTDVLAVQRIDKGSLQAGSKYDLTFKPMMGKTAGTLEYTDLQPYQRLEMDIVFGAMRPHVTFLFEPNGKGTKVTRRVQVKAPGAMKLMPFLMRRMVSKRSALFLGNLKSELESKQ
jgi:uncharacterized protein YndB with AHSA1/START domain